MEKKEKLPLRPIKRIIKQVLDGQISQDGYLYLKEVLETVATDFVDNVKEEFWERNQIRKIHGLPKFKRIPSSIFKRFSVKVYKTTEDFNDGETGQTNKETVLSREAVEVA